MISPTLPVGFVSHPNVIHCSVQLEVTATVIWRRWMSVRRDWRVEMQELIWTQGQHNVLQEDLEHLCPQVSSCLWELLLRQEIPWHLNEESELSKVNSKGSAGSGKCFRAEQSWVLTSPTWGPALWHLPEFLPAVLLEQLILPWHGQSILVVAFSPYFLWFHDRFGLLKGKPAVGNGHPHPRAGVKHGVIPHFSLSIFCQCVCQSRLRLTLWKASIISFVLISFPLFSTCLPVFFPYSGSPPNRNLRERGCVTSFSKTSPLSSLFSA